LQYAEQETDQTTKHSLLVPAVIGPGLSSHAIKYMKNRVTTKASTKLPQPPPPINIFLPSIFILRTPFLHTLNIFPETFFNFSADKHFMLVGVGKKKNIF